MPQPWAGVDFVIIGAMKSSTTTFYQYLCRHPDIFMSTPKEPQFFSMRYDPGAGWDGYRKLFDPARQDQLRGEASTCYSRWPHYGNVAGRIATHLPDVKLIYLLRHPVDRAYSHYCHRMRGRLNSGDQPVISFEEALETLPEIIDASLYMKQIQEYLKHFSRQRLLVVTFDDLHQNTRSLLNRVQLFLELEPMDLLAQGPIVANPKGAAYARANKRRLLRSVRQHAALSRLLNLVPKRARQAARNWFINPSASAGVMNLAVKSQLRQLSPLAETTRRQLLERFAEPTKQLETFMDQSLPDWFE